MAQRARVTQVTSAPAKLRVDHDAEETEMIVLALTGDCDFETVPQIDSYLRRSCGPLYYRRHLLLDLDGVIMIDSSFVGFLVNLVRNLHGERKELVIARPRGYVRKVLSLVGLPNVVPVYESLEEAKETLRAARQPLIPPLFDSTAAPRHD